MITSDEFLEQIKKYMQLIVNEPLQYEGLSAEWLAQDILDDIEQFQAEQKQVGDD